MNTVYLSICLCCFQFFSSLSYRFPYRSFTSLDRFIPRYFILFDRNTTDFCILVLYQNFPGGAMVKNPPANTGDTGSTPGPGRFHMPQSNKACVPQLLSLHSRACEPQLLSLCATTTEARVPIACALQQKKLPQ